MEGETWMNIIWVFLDSDDLPENYTGYVAYCGKKYLYKNGHFSGIVIDLTEEESNYRIYYNDGEYCG